MHGYNNKSIVIHELVGLGIEVLESRDPDQIGIKGTVIKETKNLLYVKSGSGIKKLVKQISLFRFDAEGKEFLVAGDTINFRSHERTEKALKFYKRRKS
jgi:ribonuclease P protein subunit POP4